MPKIWEKVRRGGFLFSLVIGLLIFSLINHAKVAEAATNKQFNYTGRLLDSGSQPVADGNYNMEFFIYDAVSNGNCLWTNDSGGNCGSPSPKSIATIGGIFSTELGETGDYPMINFSGSSYFLEVRIFYSSGYQTLSPRKQISAVPQSINANNLIGDGYINITGAPTGTGVGQGTVYVNPSTANTNDTILGVAVGGNLKAKIDAEGDMDLAGALASGGLNVDSGVLYSDIDGNPMSSSVANYAKNWKTVNIGEQKQWWDVCASYSNQYQAAVVFDGFIYESTDYGASWREISAAGKRDWYSISMSYSGQYQTAVDNDTGYIWRSTDYGVTWNSVTASPPGARIWQSVAVSQTGQYQTAVVHGGYIYQSSDYGATWTEMTTCGSKDWTDVAMNDDGLYQTAVADNSGYICRTNNSRTVWTEMTSVGAKAWRSVAVSYTNGQYQTATVYGGGIYYSADSGATWNSATVTPSGNKNWQSVTMSADGTYQTAIVPYGYVYKSVDHGVNWTELTSLGSKRWSSVSMNPYGDLQIALVQGGSMYRSIDYGANWGEMTIGGSREWITSAVSSNGQYQTSLENAGYIYRSSDYGASWAAVTTVGMKGWRGLAMSQDGKYQTATVTSGYIYQSSDYGVNWTEKTTVGSKAWRDITMSSTGQYQTAVVSSGYVYRSTNYGVDWTEMTSLGSKGWHGVAMSSTGQYQTAGVYGGYLYKSTNFGVDWTEMTSVGSKNWGDIAMSADGNIQTVAVYSGYIYKSTNYGANWTEMTAAGSKTWNGIDMSLDGHFQIAVDGGSGYIYKSTDYGANWITATEAGVKNWYEIAMSSDGKYNLAAPYDGLLSLSIEGSISFVGINTTLPGQALTVAGNLTSAFNAGYLSTDNVLLSSLEGGLYFGNTSITENQWENTNYADSWSQKYHISGGFYDVAVSSDGKFQAVADENGYLLRSIDYGNTWNSTGPYNGPRGVAMSADGKIQTSVGGSDYIYVSNDYGVTWSQRGSDQYWQSVTMSADGKYQTAVIRTDGGGSGYIYNSNDFGVTWTQNTSAASLNWYKVTMSSDGKIQLAVVNGGGLYRSTNYGTNWVLQTSAPSASNWRGVAMSDNGQFQSAVAYGGNICTSNDYGSTWASHNEAFGAAWYGVEMSSDGKIQTAVASYSGGNIWSSTNYGATWNKKAIAYLKDYFDIDMSSDGKIQVAVTTDDPEGSYYSSIYVSKADSYNMAEKIGIGTSTSTFNLTVNGNIGSALSPTLSSLSRTTTSFESYWINEGIYTKIAIGVDGFPIIAYRDEDSGDIMVTHCSDIQCTTGTTTQFYNSHDMGGYGNTISLAIGTDGLPILSYFDYTTYDLIVTKCNNISCSDYVGSTTTIVDSSGTTGAFPSIAIGQDGLPRIAYYDTSAGGLQLLKCSNSACSNTATNTITTGIASYPYDSATNTIMKIGPDGLPMIVYHNSTGEGNIGLVKCGNSTCSSGNTVTAYSNQSNATDQIGAYQIGLAIDSNNIPLFSYYNDSSVGLWVVKCSNTACSSGNTETKITYAPISDNHSGLYSSIAIGVDGLPIISYQTFNDTYDDLVVTKCSNSACSDTANNTTTIISDSSQTGKYTSIAIGINGLPIISYYDYTEVGDGNHENLLVTACVDFACSQTTATVLTGGSSIGSSSNPYQTINALQFSNPTAYFNLSFSLNGTEKMTITPSGLIGIGDTAPASGLSVNLANSNGVSADFLGKVGIGTTNPTFALTVDGNIGAGTSPVLSSVTRTIAKISDQDSVGYHSSVAVGSDGLPVISYLNVDDQDIMITKCGNASCSSGNTTTQITNTDDVGEYNSIALDSNNYPVISYYNATDSSLMVTKCGNVNCTAGNYSTTQIAGPAGDHIGMYSSIAIGADTYPVISSRNDSDSDLIITKCSNTSCSSSTNYPYSRSGSDGYYTSIKVPSDGKPVISHFDSSLDDLAITKCADASCSSITSTNTFNNGSADVGEYSKLAIGGDGYPVASYMDHTNDDLVVTKCGDANCTSGSATTNTITNADAIGLYIAMAIGSDGFPVINYFNDTDTDVTVSKCGDAACTPGSVTTTQITSVGGTVGRLNNSIAIGSDTYPILTAFHSTYNYLQVYKCSTASCSSSSPYSIGDTGDIGSYSSTAIGPDGLPIIGHYDKIRGDVWVTKCGNADCTIGNVNTMITNTADDVGSFINMAIGTDGLPILSYFNNTDSDIMITKCGNSDCTSENTTNQIDTSASYTSMAIGTDGFPIISFRYNPNGNLGIIHCLNSICSTNETMTEISNANNVGYYSSIVIGSDGFPIISYKDDTSGYDDIVVTHCTNVSCSTYDPAVYITDASHDSGRDSFVAIGSDGLPIIIYGNDTDDDVMVTKCNNLSCSSSTTAQINNADNVGENSSIAIGKDGLPIIATFNSGGGSLVIYKCNDLVCSSAVTETEIEPNYGSIWYSFGSYTSIIIGANGLPIVSFHDNYAGNLVVMSCADATCASTSGTVISGGSSVGGFKANSRSYSPTYKTLNALQISNPTSFSNLSFSLNGTERLTITPSGLIGIGDTTPVSALSVGIANSSGVSADFLGKVGIGTSTPTFSLTVDGNIGASSAPTLSSISRTNADIEPDYSGYFHSITIGTDGLPIIAYFNSGDYALMVTKCGNTQCSSGNITTTIVDADVDEIGWNPSITIGSDGLPVISHHNETDGDLIITKCGNIACSSGNTTTQIHDSNNYDIGDYSDIVIGSDGFPIVEYYDNTNYVLMVSKCNNHDCTSRAATSVFSSPGSMGKDGSIAIGTDGLPIISTTRDISPGTLAVVKCGDLACTTGSATITQITDSGSDWWGYQTSIAIGKDGLPVISHYNGTDLDLTITKCSNIACTKYASNQIADSGSNDIGMGTSLAIGTDGLPIISYFNDTDDDLMITKCGDTACTPTGVTTTQINYGNNEGDNGGTDSSITIGSDGLPIVGYLTTDYSTIYNLVTTACADPTCSLSSGNVLSGGSTIGSSATSYQTVNTLGLSNPTAFSNLTFSSNGVARLTITPGGLVGIGTTAPKEALEVAGNISISKTVATPETWTATSTSTVTARYGHTAVWTGSKMIVWGGITTGGTYINTGYSYDPVANTWTAISTTNAPAIRAYHSAVWTGSKMIIFGGYDGSSYLGTGAMYDPSTDTWITLGGSAPTGRAYHSAVWTGSKMIICGGQTASATYNNASVYAFDPSINSWSAALTSIPVGRSRAVAVWNGSKMYVIGGRTASSTYSNTSIYAYDPAANTWSAALTVIPAGRSDATAVWTGSRIIVWGGRSASATYLNSGYSYDPLSNTWSAAMATSPAARMNHTAVWTGTKMIVWGGQGASYLYDGAVYDPVANSWVTMAAYINTNGHTYSTAVWTGTEMIVFGGWNGTTYYNDGGIYVPANTVYGGNLFVEGDGLINGELKTVGPITSGGFYSLSGADLAETYLSKDNLEPGTLITPDILTSGAISISKGIPYDNTVIGVVSTLPGMTLGYGSSPNETYPYSLPIALAGRVPVRVSDENGQINVGDPITSSSIPGVAMKAINEGNTLGTALESFDPTTQGEQCESNPEYTCSKILAYVSMSYIRPVEEGLDIESVLSDMEITLKEQENRANRLKEKQVILTKALTSIDYEDSTTLISGMLNIDNLSVGLDINIFGKAVANGDVIISGNSEFNNNVTFKQETNFYEDTLFTGNLVFNKDSAGLITIKRGSREAVITFTQEYIGEPTIFADISLHSDITDADKKLITEALSANTLGYMITNQSTKGFTIELTENAPADIRFSWQAICVSTTTTTTKP